MYSKPVLNRRVLLSGSCLLGLGAIAAGPAQAGLIDDLRAELVPTLYDLLKIRARIVNGVQSRKAATLSASPDNPYLRPVGPRLSATEQAAGKHRVATGAGL